MFTIIKTEHLIDSFLSSLGGSAWSRSGAETGRANGDASDGLGESARDIGSVSTLELSGREYSAASPRAPRKVPIQTQTTTNGLKILLLIPFSLIGNATIQPPTPQPKPKDGGKVAIHESISLGTAGPSDCQ